jgi:hypothetical protein
MAGSEKQRRKTMKLLSNHELQQRSESELAALFRTVSEGLVRTRIKISLGRCRSHRLLRGSPEQRNALASFVSLRRI